MAKKAKTAFTEEKMSKKEIALELENLGWKKTKRGWNSPPDCFSENHRGLSLKVAASFEDLE